jgi:glycerophosphoryl diester phosphodiesterase
MCPQKRGLDIITWTLERSDLRQGAANAGFYYLFGSEGKAIKKDSDMYKPWAFWPAT